MDEAQFIYEVTVNVVAGDGARAITFMKEEHIPEVLKHPAFIRAEFYPEVEATEGTFSFTTHYYVRNSPLFEQYIQTYAKEMREHFLDQFASSSPTVERRLLKIPRTFKSLS